MVRTLDEIMRAGHELLDAREQPPEHQPAEHDTDCHFEAMIASGWWGWWELRQSEVRHG